MLVYRDIVSGDEMISDAYGVKPLVWEGSEVEGFFEVDSKVVVKDGDNVDIGCGDAFGGASADEGADDSVEKVNNVIEAFRLQELPFESKGQLKEYLKEYVRKVRAAHKEKGTAQEDIKAFMAAAPEIVKFLLANFSEWQTYMGESMNADAGMAFAYFKEEALAPSFVFVKFGYLEEKC